jgi:hypothetical protein
MSDLQAEWSGGLASRQEPLMSRRMQLICIRTAVPMVILLFGGLVLSGFINPLSPNSSAASIAHTYRTHTDRIRFGLALSFLSVILIFPFGAAIAAQARRIEGAAPVLTYTQVAAIGSGSLIFVLPWCCWMAAAFRPERAASQIMLLNDLGWLIFTFSFVAFTSWNFALGLAILSDTSRSKIFPRWVGYYNIFVGMTFIPDLLVPFFKTGPFDWRGIVPYWFPFAVYGVWIILMMVMTTKAIRQEAQLDLAGRQPSALVDDQRRAVSAGHRDDSPALPSL